MNQIASVGERTSLPGLIDRASGRLIEARTSAEVLEAKAIAELALHYAKVTKAANESHADCLRIITRAEIRMANEVDAAQERGEVRGVGRPPINSPNLGELNLDSRRVAEWRETRDAGEEIVEAAISDALAEGRAPTKSDIRKRVRPSAPDKSEIEELVENFFTVADLALRVKNLDLKKITPTPEMVSLVREVVEVWSNINWRRK